MYVLAHTDGVPEGTCCMLADCVCVYWYTNHGWCSEQVMGEAESIKSTALVLAHLDVSTSLGALAMERVRDSYSYSQ